MEFLKARIATPIEFISGGQFVSEVPWIHTRRNIESFELIIGVHKTLYIEQEDTKYEVNPGDVLLLLPHRVHRGYQVCSEDLSFYWLHFLCPGGFELIDENEMAHEVSFFRTNLSSRLSVANVYIPLFSNPPGIERVNILFHQLLHVANSNYYTFHSVHYLLTSLLIELSEQTIANFYLPQNGNQGDLNLAKIMEWIRINAMSDISVASIAKKFNYNKDYLSRSFKRKTGMNLQEYIHLLKISKAKDLLSGTTRNIKEIAGEVGIRDEKYFMKLFKKYEKMTPSQFRKAYYQIHMNNK